jgi:hypothetical protein
MTTQAVSACALLKPGVRGDVAQTLLEARRFLGGLS